MGVNLQFFLASEFQAQRNNHIGISPLRNDSLPVRRPQHVGGLNHCPEIVLKHDYLDPPLLVGLITSLESPLPSKRCLKESVTPNMPVSRAGDLLAAKDDGVPILGAFIWLTHEMRSITLQAYAHGAA